MPRWPRGTRFKTSAAERAKRRARPRSAKEKAATAARNRARRKLGLKVGDPRHADHIRSLNHGGTNARSNLRAISAKANMSRPRGRYKGGKYLPGKERAAARARYRRRRRNGGGSA